jgi:hypothetical protein
MLTRAVQMHLEAVLVTDVKQHIQPFPVCTVSLIEGDILVMPLMVYPGVTEVRLFQDFFVDIFEPLGESKF